ncbi:unnamed protein product [Closterium sp. NIES-53]
MERETLELEAPALEAMELEELELETLALEALELEALALEALELEALELDTLELEVLALGVLELAVLVLEALCRGASSSFRRHRRLCRHLTRERREPESRHGSPVCAVCTGRRDPHPRPPPVPGTHIMTLRPSSVPPRVSLPPPPESSLPAVADLESDLSCASSPTVPCLLATVVTDPSFESIAASALVAELVCFATACRLEYTTSLVAESESDYPPSVGGEFALSTDVLEDRQEDFEVKRPPGSPPVFKARYVARGFSQGQGVDFFQTFSPTPKMTTLRLLLHVPTQHDFELRSLDFSTASLQGSLHEEIGLRRPSGFTRSFPAGTQWSLRRLVLQRFDFRYSSPQSTPLPTGHLLSAPPSDESVEPNGPYPEFVGCLMYLMSCTRPDLAYPLSILARYTAPGRHRPEH